MKKIIEGGKKLTGKAKRNADMIALDPGRFVNNNIIGETIKTPVTGAALKTIPIPGSSAAIKYVGKPEKFLQKKLGVSGRFDKAGETYKKSKFAERLRTGLNTGIETLKHQPILM